MAHPVPVPQTMAALLEIVECHSQDSWIRIAAILAWAARQPDSAAKLPDAWHAEMEREEYHPGTDALDEAVRVGRKLRDLKFVPMPKSRWDVA